MKGNIVLFIVEGPSDQDALIPWITEEFKKLKIKVTVKVVFGDFLTEYSHGSRNFNITPGNVKGEIKKLIEEYLKRPSSRADQIKLKDIEKIYYITDTDNCFINLSSNSLNKKNCLFKMFNFHYIEMKPNKRVKFEVIFFAKNLEDVICSKESATDIEKEKISIEFGVNTLKDRELFIKTFISETLKSWDSYFESYEGIKSYTGRACNMNNLIIEIEKNWNKPIEN